MAIKLPDHKYGDVTYNYVNTGTLENPVFEYRSSKGTVLKEGSKAFTDAMREEAMKDLAAFKPAATEAAAKTTDAVADAAKPTGTTGTTGSLSSPFMGVDDVARKAQRRDLAQSIGPMALVGGIGSAIQLGQAFAPGRFGNVQDRYAAEQLDELQRRQARGQLGLTQGERAEMERQMLNPVRQQAAESQRRAEEERASTGITRSAAGQVRGERERQRLLADQARQAGAQIVQADMQKADQELSKMESLMAYQASRQQQALANLQKTGMDIAYLAGISRAGKGMKQIDPKNLVDAGVDESKAPDLARRLSAKAGGVGGLRSAEVGRELERAGFNPDSATYKNVMGTYRMQIDPPTERTFGEGRTSLQERRIQQATGPDIVEPPEGQGQVSAQFAGEQGLGNLQILVEQEGFRNKAPNETPRQAVVRALKARLDAGTITEQEFAQVLLNLPQQYQDDTIGPAIFNPPGLAGKQAADARRLRVLANQIDAQVEQNIREGETRAEATARIAYDNLLNGTITRDEFTQIVNLIPRS